MADMRDTATKSPPPTNWSVNKTKSSTRGGPFACASRSKFQTGTYAAQTETGEVPWRTGLQNSSSTVVAGRRRAHQNKNAAAPMASTTAATRMVRLAVRTGGVGCGGTATTGAGASTAACEFMRWNSGT